MNGKELLSIVYFFVFCHLASCDFLHVPSKNLLKPETPGLGKEADFGFSIGYQDINPPKLVIGAPRQDYIGQLYTCPIGNLSTDISCLEINTKSLKEDIKKKSDESRKSLSPNQNFFLGASIAATKDFFLTCAPLMTGFNRRQPHRRYDSYGKCYVYRNTENEFKQYLDNFYVKNPLFEIVAGGTGWSSLVDEKNGRILVDKTSNIGDITYVHIANPLEQSQSIYRDVIQNNISARRDDFQLMYYNFGYGIAVGTFFDNATSLYAVSWQGRDTKGNILFLEKNAFEDKLQIMNNTENQPYYITNDELGSMFGYALAAADLNLDTLSELLVGVPAYSEYGVETGALLIYLGGNMLTVNDKNRTRTIIGNAEYSRFGSAIATNDLDGDNIPEIFVSATYEDYGTVYILSGYELNQKFFKESKNININVSNLKMTQKLKGDSHAARFGFSLQIVKDIDKNGCDELAIGSPASNSVSLLRCLPAVNTTISLDYGNKTVNVSATEFTVSVCVNVITNPKCKEKLYGRIEVTSDVKGDATIKEPKFYLDLTKEYSKCQNITVTLNKEEEGEYPFTSKLNLLHDEKIEEKVYRSWVVLSPYRELEKTINVQRYCTGLNCKPDLSLDIKWTGFLQAHNDLYEIGSSKEGSFEIAVENHSADANKAYVELVVSGAPILQLLSKDCYEKSFAESYRCDLPKLKRGTTYKISVLLDMTKLYNSPKLEVKAHVHDTLNNHTSEAAVSNLPYKFNTDDVKLNGSSSPLSVTDKDVADKNIITICDNHEYKINNTGPVTWRNLTAVLKIKKKSFINKVKMIPAEKCKDYTNVYKTESYVFHCDVNLNPRAVMKIIASIDISKEKFGESVSQGNLLTSSDLSITLEPTEEKLSASVSTQITYQEILSVGNNKLVVTIIFVILALILLLVLAIALYKYGFFQREQKKKLALLREKTRKRSIRLNSDRSSRRDHISSVVDEDHCNIEVVDDSPFEEVAPSAQATDDDVVLIEEKAQVHS